ncbi:G patch domain-containing protein [Actinidia chinensis var. chinensis]|uniref:G patch domain-containing protein n=1 Tax=Actinidia chinensis var. chinensis TaxID=1590841 RepID=A0A2R6QI56_ACTCC|nr:G patch domain-containing protein [Actinidia chinensis var. chinensis]
MDSDEEDYVFYGTPIEREEEITSRKKKAVAEASGQLRTLAPWKQEVTDEEGRRRFHGAFTGGYSAGYYNTVGSKEGWTPQSFTSSRKNRAEIQQQSILNFLDDDEKGELEGRAVATSMQFDTFGFTAAELARKQVEKEQQKRPSIIPGPAPDEIVLPAADSIGVKLLLKMGWRHGHAIRDSRTNSLYDARREARKAFLALSSDDSAAMHAGFEPVKGDLDIAVDQPMDNDHQHPHSTPVYVLNPKQNLHGLGYDPFKHAPEFREKKRSRLPGNKELGHRKGFSMKDNLLAFRSGRTAPGFGIGALEELDAEDEDVYASGYDFEETYVQEIEEPLELSIESKKMLSGKEQGVLPGFKVASTSDYQLERSFCNTKSGSSDSGSKVAHWVVASGVTQQQGLRSQCSEATLGAQCSGERWRDCAAGFTRLKENNGRNFFAHFNCELLDFECDEVDEDHGAHEGCEGFTRGAKLWEAQQKRTEHKKLELDGKVFPSVQKMTAESRGKILGERPLERSSNDTSSASTSADIQLQFNLSDTFTKPASFNELPDVAKPFRDDPAKQGRFEQFLKEKYHGGLRSKDSSGSSYMSEAARAREKLEFEAAAEAIRTGKWGKETGLANQQFIELSVTTGLQFTSAGLEQGSQEEELMKKMYPKREEFQWRPSPILCKRFDIMDPYMGKPPPPPRVRSKMDSLIFMPDSVKHAQVEETKAYSDSLPVPQSGMEDISKKEADREVEVDVEVENVERPVDLYKAIFSDDSDDEEESSSVNQMEDPQKKVEAANTTLNRLIAGDFLESLGKELGLEVPPDLLPHLENKAMTSASQKENDSANKGQINAFVSENKSSSTLNTVNRTFINQDTEESKEYQRDDVVESSGNIIKTLSSEKKSGKVELGKVAQVDRINRTPSDRHRNRSSSSSEDERRRKRSRRHRHRSSNSDSDTSDSSDDYRDRHHSRSKGRKQESSREKSSSRKHSKHRKRDRRDSLGRSHRDSEKDRETAKREKRR